MKHQNTQNLPERILIPQLQLLLEQSIPAARTWRHWLKGFQKTDEGAHANNPVEQRSFINQVQLTFNLQPGTAVIWCHPVELIPDLKGVRLAKVLNLEQALERWKDLLNDYFDNRFRFELFNDELILISKIDLPDNWKGIQSLIGQNLFVALDEAKKTTHWFQLVNEIQMFCHHQNLNNTENPTLPVDGFWLSHIPEWMNMNPNPYYHCEGMDKDSVELNQQGYQLFLYQEFEQLNQWLEFALIRLQRLYRQNPNLYITDGKVCWSPGRLTRAKNRLLKLIKR